MRHRCLGCGGSCQGVVVRLLDDEVKRIARLGDELGIDGIVDQRLRQDADGRCVFLDDAQRCRIHATFGADAKPAICSQYPAVVVDTGRERRMGIDPGCYTAFRTQDADPIEVAGLKANRVPMPPDQEGVEGALVQLLGPGQTVGGALSILCREPVESGIPTGFAGRWLTALQSERLVALASQPDAGPSLRACLGPVLAGVLARDEPPEWTLRPELDAWGVEVARRMVHLRLARLPIVQATAILALGGVVAAGWTWPDDPDRFGASVAAWARAMRAPPFWSSLIREPADLMRLVGAQ